MFDDYVIDPVLLIGLDSVPVNEAEELKFSKRAGYEAYIQRRINQCCTMTLKIKENPETGKRYAELNHCGQPDCPRCGPKIKEKLAYGIKEQLAYGPLRQHSVYSKEERAKVIRKYGKENVACFPVETEEGVRFDFLIKTKDLIGQEYSHINSDDLANWSKNVFQHSKSGSLTKDSSPGPAKEEKADDIIDDRIEIEAEEYIVDFGQMENNEDIFKEVEQVVIEETKELNPKTIEELELALSIRRLKFREVVARHYGVILHVNKRIVLINLPSLSVRGGLLMSSWNKAILASGATSKNILVLPLSTSPVALTMPEYLVGFDAFCVTLNFPLNLILWFFW